MNFFQIIQLAVILIFTSDPLEKAFGLECFQCVYFENESGSEFLKSLDSRLNINCKYPVLNSISSRQTCPADMQCGAVSGKVSIDIPLAGKMTAEMIVRDCMPASGNGCDAPTSGQRSVLNTALGFMAGVNVDDARVCICNTNLCDALCGNGSVRIGEYCIKLWMLIAGGIGGCIALLFLATCCCCCCCCSCCRSKSRNRGVVIQPTPQPVLATTVNSMHNIQFATYVPSHVAGAQSAPPPYDKNWDITDDTAMLIA